jgi:signal transduction histidine kinase
MNSQRERYRRSLVCHGHRHEVDETARIRDAVRREERRRLAGDLHDSVTQALFALTLQTRALELVAKRQGEEPDGAVGRGLAEMRELTRSALAEMRALIFELRPENLHEDGLVAALRRHAATLAVHGSDVTVSADADQLPLDEHVERELFHLIREAVHNSVKHARPSTIEIRLYGPDADGTLVVEVADDGIGFDPDDPYPGHLGLKTMRERAEGLGGRFTVDSSPIGSTTVRVVLPCPEPVGPLGDC